MKTIKNDYCIRQFVSGDMRRPVFTKVSLHDGYLYSTDSHIVGKIKADLCVHNYIEVENYPNAEKIISDHKTTEKKTISVDTLFNDLMLIKLEFKPEMVKCDNCAGNGDCTCDHCDSVYDCNECDGTGKKAGNEIKATSEHNCVLLNKEYQVKYLDLIIRTAVYTGVKEIEISNGTHETSGTIFTVGDFTILLMPVYRYSP